MGMFDTAKLMQKAMKARSTMSKVKAVGKGGSLGMIINGLYDVTHVEIDRDEFLKEIGNPEIDSKLLDKIISTIEKNLLNASKDSKKALEGELRNTTSVDQLRDMLGE